MMHWGGDFGMSYGFGGIFMILFWALIILGVVYLMKLLAGKMSCGSGQAESPEEVLKKRFARGEISREELAEALAVLRKDS